MIKKIDFFFRVPFLLPLPLLLILIFCCQSVSAQDFKAKRETKKFSDSSQLDKYFYYRLDGSDTVFHGRHELVRKPLFNDTLSVQPYEYEEISLQFDNNVRQGKFLRKEVYFTPHVSKMQAARGEITIPFKGRSLEVAGQYNDGRPSGPWWFESYEHDPEKGADTVLMLQASFGKTGVFQERFTIIDAEENVSIAGNFGSKGSFNGVVEVHNKEKGTLLLSYLFEDGLLRSINIAGEAVIQPAYMESESSFEFQEQPLDSLYSRIISYYIQKLPAEKRDRVLMPLSDIYSAFHQLAGGRSSLQALLPGGKDIPAPLLRLPIHETNKEEIDLINNFNHRLILLNQKIDSLQSRPSFSLNRYTNKELASLYAQVNYLRKIVIQHRGLIEMLSGPMLRHIDPKWFLGRRLDEITQLDTISYQFGEESISERVDYSYQVAQGSAFQQYEGFLSKLEETLSDLTRRSVGQMESLSQDIRLEETDEQIASLSENVDQLLDTLDFVFYNDELSMQFKESVARVKKQELIDYANREPQSRVVYADSLINCLQQLQEQLNNVQSLVTQAEAVDVLYTDKRLNPYTYTEMEVRKFERLFLAYQDVLVPYLVERMAQSNNCGDFQRQLTNLKTLQDFMVNALEGNPGRLDRRARNQKDPEALIRRLGIPLI